MMSVKKALSCILMILPLVPCFQSMDTITSLGKTLLKLKEDSLQTNNVDLPVDDPSIVGGWGRWSPWMSCSRACDGGISMSIRKCKGKCTEGQPIRRRICNMQPCAESADFRATQCSAYNNKPYRDRKYVWLPYYDPEEPCALTCQAEGFNFVAKHSQRVQDGTRCREGALDMCVDGQCQPIGCDLQVGSTLQVDACGVCGGDGSMCQRPAFLWHEGDFAPCSFTCGGGIQQTEITCRNKETNEAVDPRLCNLSVRPRNKARHCNREPCPIEWATGKWGACSATCGTGVQARPVFCVQGGPNGSRIDVQSNFCPRHKPSTERECDVQECPRWFQGPWTSCSVTCGQGVQIRAVVCRDTGSLYSDHCDPLEKPLDQKECNTSEPCPTAPPCVFGASTEDDTVPTTTEESTTPTEPDLFLTQAPVNESSPIHYFVGPWGSCNGEGYRSRMVHCQIFIEIAHTVAKLPDTECQEVRPVDVEPCSVSCPPPFPPREKDPENDGEKEPEKDVKKELEKDVEKELEKDVERPLEKEREKDPDKEVFEELGKDPGKEVKKELGKDPEKEVKKELGKDPEKEVKKELGKDPEKEVKKELGKDPAKEVKKEIGKDPEKEIKKELGKDPAKEVKKVLVKEPETEIEEDTENEDLVEVLVEEMETTTPDSSDRIFYSWNTEKFTPCSASCSGGKHSAIIRCLRLPDEVEVSPQLCDLTLKPGPFIKRCNEEACPVLYKWNITKFGNCSKECGGGIQTRQVKCLSVVEDVEVSVIRCPGHQPKAVESCNVFDCEPAWKTETWSKCSRSCGGGFQSRKLHCARILAPLGQAIQLPPSKCLKTRPKAIKKCNLKPCPLPPRTTTTTTTTTTEVITVDENTYVQEDPNSRVILKASGQAVLFKGSNAKFHCPMLNMTDHRKVLWFRGHLRIPPATANGWPRVAVSGKGALRIHKVTYGDSGTYTCLAGAFRSDLMLRVKSLPADVSKSLEFR